MLDYREEVLKYCTILEAKYITKVSQLEALIKDTYFDISLIDPFTNIHYAYYDQKDNSISIMKEVESNIDDFWKSYQDSEVRVSLDPLCPIVYQGSKEDSIVFYLPEGIKIVRT